MKEIVIRGTARPIHFGMRAINEFTKNTKGDFETNISTTEAIAMGSIPMEKASAEYELETYKPFFTEACEGGKYDLIVTCGAECNADLVDAAANYPEQLFFGVDMQDVPQAL